MSLREIVFSSRHLISPLTTGEGQRAFTPLEKASMIALSILIGLGTAGVGGVAAFYLMTAAQKAKLHESKRALITSSNGRSLKIPVSEMPKNDGGPYPFLNALSRIAVSSYPSSVECRRFPPLSGCDTVIYRSGRIQSAHPEDVKFYQDHEILAVHPPVQTVQLGSLVQGHMTGEGKIVIQQQAKRGCTAAVAAMLASDAGKNINVSLLRSTNLGSTATIQSWLREAGLASHVVQWKRSSSHHLLYHLKLVLEKRGPAIVTTENDIDGHVVIVDAIDLQAKTVRLRDPYHGWDITVTQEAFMRGFRGGEILQLT